MNKTKADTLLINAIVLTMDEAFTVINPGAVAIENGTILAVDRQDQILQKFTAQIIHDCGGKALMPGLVNAHTHVPMTLLRGLADDLRLDVWLLGYMMPVERQFVSPDFVKLGTKLACLEMIRSGVTCFADMYYFEDHVAQATAEIGMRAVCSQTVMKYPTPDAQFFEESLALAREFIQKWKGHPLIIPSVAPHAPYTCTEEILRLTAELAAEFDVPLHTHIAETAQEVESARDEYGMPVVPYVKKIGLFETKALAAHCVHIDEGEMNTLLHHNVGVAHNPSSNLKLASGFAPVTKMLELGLHVGIGTDGTASNNDLDMFEEVRLAAILAKNVSNDPTSLPARTALAMATRIGAEALHLSEITGSIQPGKKADVILVDLNRIHNSPRFMRDPNNIYAQIVYATKSTDVSDVMVDGKWLMQDHQLLVGDEAAWLAEAQDYAARIDAFLIQREKSVLSKLVAIGNATEEESFEVQAKVRIADAEPVYEALEKPEIEVLHFRHYHEYDTYFLFPDPEQGTLRYREDEIIDPAGQVIRARYRLTMIGPAREYQFPREVLLSRSRFLAPANHSLRFYREYFKPTSEVPVVKDRQRWRLLFRGTEFYLNLDRLEQPPLGYFLEVKSRTWSKRDAEHKAEMAAGLLEFLGASIHERVSKDYLELVLEIQPT
ncbi:MAG: amidohydrolase [Anaerolineae bacterium UTCFX2]|jgi:5-methylthioadenosine/S-adenosylhomocysteine deaminase|nr:amidohydrolase family protein [Anaerolineae bacterium]MCZ7551011.1 amidohydrolase [Anaerolineales bacterium]OQY88105.1 MAG: amidohydrolase [Anaerolineae bacterium UTCFX2]